MINEIKTIVDNYLNNRKVAHLQPGTVVDGGGIKISEKLTLPSELIVGNLKDNLKTGDGVWLLRDDGGQLFYVLEIVGLNPATEDRTLSIEPITVTNGMTISSIKIKDVVT